MDCSKWAAHQWTGWVCWSQFLWWRPFKCGRSCACVRQRRLRYSTVIIGCCLSFFRIFGTETFNNWHSKIIQIVGRPSSLALAFWSAIHKTKLPILSWTHWTSLDFPGLRSFRISFPWNLFSDTCSTWATEIAAKLVSIKLTIPHFSESEESRRKAQPKQKKYPIHRRTQKCFLPCAEISVCSITETIVFSDWITSVRRWFCAFLQLCFCSFLFSHFSPSVSHQYSQPGDNRHLSPSWESN